MIINLNIGDIVSNIFYSICSGISSIIQYIFSLLPNNPFSNISVPTEIANTLGYLNYFLPIKQSVVIIAAWLFALVGICLYKLIFSFFKLIGG